MQHKTKGIVLQVNSYNDSYSIALIYSEKFGSVSYMIPKKRGKKQRSSHLLFFPLSVLELEVEHTNLRDIQRIHEARLVRAFHSLQQDPVKTSIVFFLSEFLGKVLRESSPNALLLDYIVDSIEILDMSESSYANFHIVFILRLMQFLGFYPDERAYSSAAYFDMINGVFVNTPPLHAHYLNRRESEILKKLLSMRYDNMHRFRFSGKERHEIILKALEYYQLHLVRFSELKSLDVLRELFG